MRKLAVKITIFILPFLILGGFLEIRLKKVINSYNFKKNNLEKMLPECKVLIMGNSMAYCGIIPEQLKYIAFNFANNSQDIYYDQMLFNKYLNKLPNLKYVIIPVAFISLFNFLDKGPEYWRTSYYLRYYDIPKRQTKFDLKDASMIALYGIDFCANYLIKADMKSQVFGISIKGWRNFPNYSILNENMMKDLGRKKYIDDTNHQMDLDGVDENYAYLQKIINQSKRGNITPILISLPASKYYTRNLHDDSSFSLMQEKLAGLSHTYRIKYYNYFFDKRFIDSDFSDTIHLNSMGANKMTSIINDELLVD